MMLPWNKKKSEKDTIVKVETPPEIKLAKARVEKATQEAHKSLDRANRYMRKTEMTYKLYVAGR